MQYVLTCFSYRLYPEYGFDPFHLRADLLRALKMLTTMRSGTITVITDMIPNDDVLSEVSGYVSLREAVESMTCRNSLEIASLFTRFFIIDDYYSKYLPRSGSLFFYFSGHGFNDGLLVPTLNGLKRFRPNKWVRMYDKSFSILDCCNAERVIESGEVIASTKSREKCGFIDTGSLFTFILGREMRRGMRLRELKEKVDRGVRQVGRMKGREINQRATYCGEIVPHWLWR